MKTTKCIVLFLFVASISIVFSKEAEKERWYWGPCHLNNEISIEFENGDLLIFDEHVDELLIEITNDYELYVREKHIETNAEEKDLLRRYYSTTDQMLDEVEKLGYKGAKIGLRGAKVAVKAVGGVFEILFSGFDESVIDDFEERIEAEAEEIEHQAEQLEDEAEIVDELADQLDTIYENLAQSIPELEELEIEFDDE
jgi:hypothetical protein